MMISIELERIFQTAYRKAALHVKKEHNLTNIHEIQSVVEKENGFTIRTETFGWDYKHYIDFLDAKNYTMFILRWS